MPSFIRKSPMEFRNTEKANKKVVLAAIKQNENALSYASEELKGNKFLPLI